MIVKQDTQTFTPITITLESMKDLETLVAILGRKTTSLLRAAHENNEGKSYSTSVHDMDTIGFILYRELFNIYDSLTVLQ